MLDGLAAKAHFRRVSIDVFVDELDLAKLGFDGVEPEATGRPAYHPATLLKIYVYGYLNRVQSSRRLERECQRNIELVWLTGRLMPDFKTIADFRKDNGEAIRRVCREFVVLCRRLELFSEASVAIDGSKFKAVNTRDRNFTQAKMQRSQLSRMSEQARAAIGSEAIEAVADRGYYSGEEIVACEQAGVPVYLPKPITSGLNVKGRFGKQDFVYVTADDVYLCPAGEQLIYHYTNEEDGKTLRRYWTNACQACTLKGKCTTGKERRISRWEHEAVLEAVQARLDRPDRIILGQIVFQALGKQRALTTVIANDKARHRILRPNRWRIISLRAFSHSLGQKLP